MFLLWLIQWIGASLAAFWPQGTLSLNFAEVLLALHRLLSPALPVCPLGTSEMGCSFPKGALGMSLSILM